MHPRILFYFIHFKITYNRIIKYKRGKKDGKKKLKSEIIYDGKIIKVYKDQVECPNKRLATREIVRHHGGVGILAVVDDCILLVKQFRYAYNKDTLEIPAGKLELGEEAGPAGKRELEEETGYSCKSMELINEIYPTTGYCDEVIHLYEAKGLFKVENPLEGDEDEFIDVISMPIDEAYKKIMNNEIHDSKTIIAIMKAYNDKYIK